MENNLISLLFFVWFIFLLIWNSVSMSISRRTINFICKVMIVINICLFLITIRFFKFWLLFFYIIVGMFFLREKFGRWTKSAYARRESVSSMQDCIVTAGAFMIVISLMLLSIMK